MIIFHPIRCKCGCGKSHTANIAGEQLDRLDLRNIDCPDCNKKPNYNKENKNENVTNNR